MTIQKIPGVLACGYELHWGLGGVGSHSKSTYEKTSNMTELNQKEKTKQNNPPLPTARTQRITKLEEARERGKNAIPGMPRCIIMT